MAAVVARRGVLGAGAAAGLALVTLSPARARPAVGPARVPITGRIACHIRLDPMRGATIRLTELDAASRPARNLVMVPLPASELYASGVPTAGTAPLRVACREAHKVAERVAAASWGVAPGSCRVVGSNIVHPQSGRSVPLATWVDMV